MHYSSIEFMIPAFITMIITPVGLVRSSEGGDSHKQLGHIVFTLSKRHA